MEFWAFILILLLVFGFPIGWFFLTMIVAMFEVYHVWPYAPKDELRAYAARSSSSGPSNNPYAVSALIIEDDPPNSYHQLACGQALAHGLVHCGAFDDVRGSLYRVRYDFFASPASNLVVQVGYGAIAKIPLSTTWMYTLLADGRCLLTLDNTAGTHHDLTRYTDEYVVPRAAFAQLLEKHRTRLGNQMTPILPFSSQEPLSDLKDFRMRRAQMLVDRNLARFIDPAQTRWRYSWLGAIRVTFFMYWSQLKPKKD